MTRLIFGLIAVAFVGGAAQAGPLGFLKNLRQKPQQNNQPAAQQANSAPAQPAAVPVANGDTAPVAGQPAGRTSGTRGTRLFTRPAANQN